MCSAIISDTLLFRSPTCTAADRRAVQELAKIAGIDPEEHARTMFRAGSDFSSKTEREILYQDFKRFKAGETVFGVGQITSMDGEELAEMTDRMAAFMAEELTEGGMDMIFLMMTDILKESTLLVCVDDGALRKVREYHDYPQQGDHALLLENVVSRKKQILPLLMTALS
jgi:manganese-dependent inorganic pyrophosphatase